jgi:hypothetical protein
LLHLLIFFVKNKFLENNVVRIKEGRSSEKLILIQTKNISEINLGCTKKCEKLSLP